MNSCELVHFISSLACVISQSTNEQELDILATFFTQLGDTLATISATKFNTKSNTKTSNCTNTDLDTDTDIDKNVDSDITNSNICQF